MEILLICGLIWWNCHLTGELQHLEKQIIIINNTCDNIEMENIDIKFKIEELEK